MTAALRIHDTKERSARWNIAATAVLTELHSDGRTSDTLRFHRYPASVLIGRHQVVGQSIHLRACEEAGIEIARRVTGGGSVYMAPGALAWDLIVGRKRLGGSDLDVARIIGEAIAAGIAQLGVAACYRAENEIAIGGRKVCGLSGYREGDTLAYQGTVLIDTDLRDMARYLRLPFSEDKVAMRLTTISETLGRAVAPNEIETAIAGAVAKALGHEPLTGSLSADELALIDERYRDEFGRDDFVFDDPPAHVASAAHAPARAANAGAAIEQAVRS
jgi:lipoate-protein ligase A